MLFSYYWGKLLLHWKRTEPRWFLNCCSDNNPMCYYRVTVVWLTCFCTCASCSHKAAMRCLLGTVHWIGATHTCPGLTNIVQYKDEHTHTHRYTHRDRETETQTHMQIINSLMKKKHTNYLKLGATWYTIWPKFARHMTIIPICGPSPILLPACIV